MRQSEGEIERSEYSKLHFSNLIDDGSHNHLSQLSERRDYLNTSYKSDQNKKLAIVLPKILELSVKQEQTVSKLANF